MRLWNIIMHEPNCSYIGAICWNFWGCQSEYDLCFDAECDEPLKYNHAWTKLHLHPDALLKIVRLPVWIWSMFWMLHVTSLWNIIMHWSICRYSCCYLEVHAYFWSLWGWIRFIFRHCGMRWGSELLLCMDPSATTSASAREIGVKAASLNMIFEGE